MMEQFDSDDLDDALVGEMRDLFARADPMPDTVLRAAHAAIELRDLDAQLIELLSDSAVEDKELAGVRGGGGRLVTFGSGERFVEVDISLEGSDRALTGYMVPGGRGEVTAEHDQGSVAADVDGEGRFRLPRVPRGPIRLRFVVPGLPPLITPWLPV